MRSFSTGDAAKITKTSVQTVIRWVDLGLLKAWKVPGSRFRRIEEQDLRAFMIKHGMPLHFLERQIEQVLFISEDEGHRARVAPLTPQGRPVICAAPFEAGMRAADTSIAVIVIDASLGELKINQISTALSSREIQVPTALIAFDSGGDLCATDPTVVHHNFSEEFTNRVSQALRPVS